MTLHPIAPSAAPRAPEPVTNSQVLRIVAFLLVGVPTAVAVNVLLWNVALWVGRQ